MRLFKDPTYLDLALGQLERLVLLVQLGSGRGKLLDGDVEVVLNMLHLLLQVPHLKQIEMRKFQVVEKHART